MYCCYSHYVIHVVKLHILPFKGVDHDTRESTWNIFDVCCWSKLNISRITFKICRNATSTTIHVNTLFLICHEWLKRTEVSSVYLSVCLSVCPRCIIYLVRTASIFKIRDRKLVRFNFFKSKSWWWNLVGSDPGHWDAVTGQGWRCSYIRTLRNKSDPVNLTLCPFWLCPTDLVLLGCMH